MTTFTIHAEDATAMALRKAAMDAETSINKYILRVLNATLGLSAKKKTRPRFLDLPKTVTKADAARLRAAQADFEKIDGDMWK